MHLSINCNGIFKVILSKISVIGKPSLLAHSYFRVVCTRTVYKNPFCLLLHETINGETGYANDFLHLSLLMSESFTDVNFHKTREISSYIINLPETDSCQRIF